MVPRTVSADKESSTKIEMSRTTTRMAETMTASGDVIANRGTIIDTAMRNPWGADYAELGMMMPEKVSAFTPNKRPA